MSTPQEKMQAFQSAQKFGKQYPGLLDALQEWATIGSLEQAADEARTRLAALRAEEQALSSMLETKAADANVAAKALIESAQQDRATKHAIATALVDEAKLEARCIIEAARATAAQMEKDAHAQVAELQALIAAAKRDLAGLTERVETKTRELATTSAAVEEKQAQRERLTRLIAELKTKL
jgi:chromosome segregation ATPase